MKIAPCKIVIYFVCLAAWQNIYLNALRSCCHGKMSYSQTNSKGVPLDHLLVELLHNKEKGFFVEVGAYDGITASNTKLLAELCGWKGILVEPSKNLFDRLRTNRPEAQCFCCALGAFEENGTYALGDFDGGLMSSFTGRTDRPNSILVLIRSLQSIFDECGVSHVDFFSLDTEGYELNILKGIDFDRTTFDYLLIEIYNHQFHDIVTLLEDKNYQLVTCLSGYNYRDNPGWDGTHNDYLFKRKSI